MIRDMRTFRPKAVENYVTNTLTSVKRTKTGQRTILSNEEYDDLLVAQKGVCAICDKPESSGKRLAVDHKHGTNLVRGLLCTKCNMGLGYFNDSPGFLFSAIKYLQNARNFR